MRSLPLLLALSAVASSLSFAPPPPATNCGAWKKGVGLNGHDISHSTTSTAAACCDRCHSTVGASKCTGWTWNEQGHGCYLKNNIRPGTTKQASVSGGNGPGPPLPVPPSPPPPPPPPPAFCAIDAGGAQPQCPWYDGAKSFVERRDALLKVMTPQEKLAVIAGRAVDRLHVVADGFNEALHGVAWAGRATVFPCPMAMGATFNASLVHDIGVIVAKEALAKHWQAHTNALSFFAPNINIVRDVRWGRAQETYGEDPTLTGKMGVAYVSGMQYMGKPAVYKAGGPVAVRNVAKHFAAYNIESNFAGRNGPLTKPAEIAKADGQYRLEVDMPVSQADLKQTYLPAFASVVEKAAIRGIMCSYNSVNGVPLCANKMLQENLRGDMGFDGIVITDCGAIGMMTGNHHWNHSNCACTGPRSPYSTNASCSGCVGYTTVEATAAALKAGTDRNCGGSYSGQLPKAYAVGLVTEAELSLAAGRGLLGHMELGLFEDNATAAEDERRQFQMDMVDSAPHRALAKQAAIEGLILLKNGDKTLPLGGAGMTTSSEIPSPHWGAKPMKLAVIGPNANRTLTLTSNYAGCKTEAGGAIMKSCTFVNPLQGIQAAAAADSKFDSEVLFAQGAQIDTPDTSGIAAAVEAASKADVAIVVTGLITCQEKGAQCQEAEARDRSTPVDASGHDNSSSTTDIGRDYGIGLPGQQLALIKALAEKTRTKIVLVVMSGSGVAVPWAAASPRVSSIIQLFYPGVLGGEALADVLFGKAAPGGKLNVMIATGEEQLPVDYLSQSMKIAPGRTHAYFTGKPLYSFGFGLGYSSWSYANLQLSRSNLSSGLSDVRAPLTATVELTNNGEWGGASSEVVLVFARPVLDEPASPNMSVPREILLGFSKVRMGAGGKRRVTVELATERLRLVGPDDKTFSLMTGSYELHVGGRSPVETVGIDSGATQAPLTTTLRVDV